MRSKRSRTNSDGAVRMASSASWVERRWYSRFVLDRRLKSRRNLSASTGHARGSRGRPATAGITGKVAERCPKEFVSERHEVTDYDLPQFQHLPVVAPVPEYLLAMKCLASRIGSPGEADDKANIRFLLRQLGLRSPEAALEIAMEYYPPARHSDSREVPARGNFDRGTMKRPASLRK